MTDYLLLLPAILSFLVTLFVLPKWIKKANQIGLLWPDMNKYSQNKVAGSGGLIAVLGFSLGLLLFVAYRVFILRSANSFLIEIFVTLSIIMFLAGIGLIDDLFGWQHGGLRRRTRLFLVILSAIPLMAINAGKSIVTLPFIGTVDFGISYALVIVPIAITGAAVTYNFLAGFNGLEAGQGILILSAVGVVGFFTGNSWITVISLCMVAALFAFLVYNFYPAKVFPGDSLTYSIGGLIAILSILGDFERVAFFFFTPYIIETALKLRGGLIKQSFGKPQEDGSLRLRYDKVYGLEHLSIYLLEKIGIMPTEKKVVYTIWIFQAVVILVGFLIFRKGIF